MILDCEQSEIGGMGLKYHEMGCEGAGKAVSSRSFKRRVLTLENDDDKERGFI